MWQPFINEESNERKVFNIVGQCSEMGQAAPKQKEVVISSTERFG